MLRALKNKCNSIRNELFSYTAQERGFILFAMLCGFFICCEYSVIRPVSNSLFISVFGTKFFPYVWLASVPVNLFLVNLYNRLVPKWGSKRLFLALTALVVGINIAFALLYKHFPALTFAYYVWKDVYVMLMFQLVWSVIHTNISFKRAKYLYGLFFGVGGMGSIVGSYFPSFFAVTFRSENLLFLSLPIYLLLLIVYLKMSQHSKGEVPTEAKVKRGGFYHGLQLISRSRFLIFALLIVTFMQTIAALVDFQFSHFLERKFSQVDLRTEYCARILGIMHALTVALQFLGSFILIQWMGFRRSHYFIPTLLALFASLVAALPIFSLVSMLFIVTKAIDFSLFGVIKEMLYVPLSADEKFRAKSVIDVFAYRCSKGVASLLVLLISAMALAESLNLIILILTLVWIGCVSYGLKNYETLVQPKETE
jgi:ATP:ADP antiporter, AAA family